MIPPLRCKLSRLPPRYIVSPRFMEGLSSPKGILCLLPMLKVPDPPSGFVVSYYVASVPPHVRRTAVQQYPSIPSPLSFRKIYNNS